MFGFFTVSADLTVTQWHDFLESLTGVGADEVIGHNLLEVFPDLKERGIDYALQHVLEMGAPLKLSRLLHGYFFMSGANTPSTQNAQIQPIKRDANTIGLLITVEDVSDQALIEADLRRHIRYLEALSSVQQQVLAGDWERVLESIVHYCIKMFNGLYAEIRLLENGDWRLAAAAPGTLAKVENRIRPYQPKIYEHVIYQRTTISLLNLADTSPYTPIHPDAAAVILAPIQNDDESLGLLVIESDTPGVFLGSGMNQVEAMAASAAAVVLAHRARQKDHLHIQALEAQLATVDISRLSDSPKEIMELGLDLIVRGLNALRGAVLLPDEQGLMLKPVALRNWPGPFYNLELSVHDPGLQGVVVRRENLLLRNLSVEGEALPQFTDLLRRYKMHPTAALITPLATEDETLGLLLIARDDDLTFSSDDIRLSSRFARLMALALQRSQVLKPIP